MVRVEGQLRPFPPQPRASSMGGCCLRSASVPPPPGPPPPPVCAKAARGWAGGGILTSAFGPTAAAVGPSSAPRRHRWRLSSCRPSRSATALGAEEIPPPPYRLGGFYFPQQGLWGRGVSPVHCFVTILFHNRIPPCFVFFLFVI